MSVASLRPRRRSQRRCVTSRFLDCEIKVGVIPVPDERFIAEGHAGTVRGTRDALEDWLDRGMKWRVRQGLEIDVEHQPRQALAPFVYRITLDSHRKTPQTVGFQQVGRLNS